jgi:lipoprotein-releasing system ATP-binding protein
MLKVIDIWKQYGTLPVLKGVNMEVKKGEIVSIVGKSGSGKSTLLHIFGTLDRPDKGTLLIDDTDVFALSAKELARFRNRAIGFVFQFHHLLPEFTALENVCIPAYIRKESEANARKQATIWLDYLGLGSRLTHKPTELSGGEQQRVAIARALMNNPNVIFADEPTGNLDAATADDLHKLLFKLRDDFQQTFIIVTHNSELAAMSDRCLELINGQLVQR